MRYATWHDPESGIEYRFEFDPPHAGEGTTVHIFAGEEHVGKTVLLGADETRYGLDATAAGATLADWQARELLGRGRPG